MQPACVRPEVRRTFVRVGEQRGGNTCQCGSGLLHQHICSALPEPDNLLQRHRL